MLLDRCRNKRHALHQAERGKNFLVSLCNVSFGSNLIQSGPNDCCTALAPAIVQGCCGGTTDNQDVPPCLSLIR
jgi:hypothetical protein